VQPQLKAEGDHTCGGCRFSSLSFFLTLLLLFTPTAVSTTLSEFISLLPNYRSFPCEPEWSPGSPKLLGTHLMGDRVVAPMTMTSLQRLWERKVEEKEELALANSLDNHSCEQHWLYSKAQQLITHTTLEYKGLYLRNGQSLGGKRTDVNIKSVFFGTRNVLECRRCNEYRCLRWERRQRRQDGVENGEGISPSQPTRVSGECHKLPSGIEERALAKTDFCKISVAKNPSDGMYF